MALLLIEQDTDIRDKVAFSLEATFGEIVLQAKTFSDALPLVRTQKLDISIVIYDLGSPDQPASVPDGPSVDALFKLFPEARLLICQDPKSQKAPRLKWKVLSNIDRTQIIANLLRILTQFSESKVITLGAQEADFCKIKTKLLLSVCPLKGDIYIRLSEDKFVKLFHQGDAFDLADMEKYTVKKGVAYLYLRKTDVHEFIEKYNADLQKLILSSQPMSNQDAAKMQENIFETVQELGNRIGFGEDVQRLAKSHVQLTLKQMGKSPRLHQILDKMKAYGGEYLGSHSAITGYMACAIASHLEWGSDLTFHKLALAAFLHDMTLTDHKLAHCNTLDEARELGYAPDQVSAYKNHPMHAAQVASQFQEVPPDVDVIIVQHHERPDATGFPRGIGHTYMAPLAMVFILAHEMAQYFIDHDSKLDLPDFLERSRKVYKSSQFRKILDAVEKLNQLP